MSHGDPITDALSCSCGDRIEVDTGRLSPEVVRMFVDAHVAHDITRGPEKVDYQPSDEESLRRVVAHDARVKGTSEEHDG